MPERTSTLSQRTSLNETATQSAVSKFSHVLPTFSRATTQSAPNNRKPPDLNKRELQSAKSQLKRRLLPLHSPHAHDTNPQGSPPYSAQFPNSRLMFLTTSSPPAFPLNNPHDARRELGCPPGHSTQNSTQLRSTPIVNALRIRQTAVGPRHNSPKRGGGETTEIRDDANYRTMETNRTSGTAEPNQTRRSNCGRGGQRRQGRQRRDRARAL